MKPEIDTTAFGKRVRERRVEFQWSQERLGTEAGYSQTNIGWIESGRAKDPRKSAMDLAEALQTTPDWLLFAKGAKETGPRILPDDEIVKRYRQLSLDDRRKVSEFFIKNAMAGQKKAQKTGT